MKDMKLGDLAFFYASGGKKDKVPGIVGIMEVVKEAEPDLSAFDEKAPYYVSNAKMRGTMEKPRWFMVHVEFRKKLTKPVTYVSLMQVQKSSLTTWTDWRSSRSIFRQAALLPKCRSSRQLV